MKRLNNNVFVDAIFEKKCWERFQVNEINPHKSAGGKQMDQANVDSMDDCETFCEAWGCDS